MKNTGTKEVKKQERTIVGKVVSNKMNKTVIVEVSHQERHPIYGKTVKKRSHIAAHSEEVLALGTMVTIVEVKPISKTKHFIVRKGNA